MHYIKDKSYNSSSFIWSICRNGKIVKISKKYKLKIIEDNAQALVQHILFKDGVNEKNWNNWGYRDYVFFSSKI